MPEPTPPTRPQRKRRWLKWLTIVAASLVVLLVILYFVATSAAFLKGVVLPRAGKMLNATITVADASISPFSEVRLTGFKIQTKGAEPLVTADEALVRYSLRDIIGGNIVVHQMVLTSPTVNLITEADGTSNLDPILKALESDEPDAKGKSTEPPKVAVRDVSLKNGTVRLVTKAKDGSVNTTELTKVDVTVDRLQNSQPGKLTLASDLKMENRFPAGSTNQNDVLQAKLSGGFDYTLAADLMPQSMKGSTRLDVGQTSGTYAELNGLAGQLNADLTPSELRDVSLQFTRGGQALGRVRVNGPLDLSKQEGRLNIAVESIDKNVLNLVGASQGWDFGASTLNATSHVAIAKSGQAIATSGRLSGRKLAIEQKGQRTPELDLDVDYQIDVDVSAETAQVRQLNIAGRQNQAEFIRATLDKPMTITWSGASTNMPDSTFQFVLTGLNLRDWAGVVMTNPPTGTLSARATVASLQGGKLLKTDFSADLRGLAMEMGSNRVDQADVTLQATAQVLEMKTADVSQLQLAIKQQNQQFLTANGTAKANLETQDLDAQFALEASLPNLIRLAALTNVQVTAGMLKSQLTLQQRKDQQTATGSARLEGFTGSSGDLKFQRLDVTKEFQIAVANGVVNIQRGSVALTHNGQPAGKIDLAGRYGITNETGQLTLKLDGINQHLLTPVLAPMLEGKRLTSIAINGDLKADLALNAESNFKGAVRVADFLVEDPQVKTPAIPVSLDLDLDVGYSTNAVSARKLTMAVQPAREAGGTVDLTANWDNQKNAGQFNFKVAGLNQHLFRPFLEPALAPRKLVSIAMNGSGSGNINAEGDSAIKADLALSNLVVQDPTQPQPAPPISAQFQLDGGMKQQVLDLKQCVLTLSPTQRAKNQVQLSGRVDLKQTNATPSTIALRAESLDVTPFYDLLAGGTQEQQKQTAATAPRQPAPAPAAQAGPEKEPEPMELPIQRLTAELKVDRFFLRDIAASNVIVNASIDGGKVNVKPMQLSLNGAPLNATVALDLSVPGYTYDVSFTADRVPLLPLTRSFAKDSSSELHGELLGNAQIKGAGTTGKSLQRNLAGQFSLTMTNLDLQIMGPKWRRILQPIALALRVPELAQTPINWIDARGQVGQGTINVQKVAVLSAAFYADSSGSIPMAEVLTNSPLNLPLNLSLRRSHAEKAKLLSPETPADAAYVSLPSFVTVKGTIGEPKSDINERGLLALTTRAIAPRVGGDAGRILQGVGGILGGQRSAPPTNAPPNTGKPADTNQPTRLNPLDLFKLLPPKK